MVTPKGTHAHPTQLLCLRAGIYIRKLSIIINELIQIFDRLHFPHF